MIKRIDDLMAPPPPLFKLGRVVATPGALAMLERNSKLALTYLNRHVTGDWGDLDADDKAENDRSVNADLRILSSYHVTSADTLWIITEHDRSATTLLLPSEY